MCLSENHLVCKVVIRDKNGKVLVKGKSRYGRLSPEIVSSRVYHDLIEERPELADIETFLCEFSEDFHKKYCK
jgi:hypothetical protein